MHSPFGGQGLNLGIGDAVNLGWKLAATVKGWAPETLLDTYTTERHPIGAWALEWTRAQVALMRPERHEIALTSVVTDLIATRDGATYFAKKVSGVWQRYDLRGDHPLIGGALPTLNSKTGADSANIAGKATPCCSILVKIMKFANWVRGGVIGLEFSTFDRKKVPS